MSATSEAETASGKPNGENFNDEMKDYAKSTMNELLGMFGYEEAITREAVEELQIRLLPEEDDENIQPTSDTLDKPMETDKDEPVAVNLNAGEAPVVVPMAGGENGGNPSVLSAPIVNNGVIPVSTTAQPLTVVPVIPSGASSEVKPGTALAPHFLAEPPNVKGVYCVVASLPVVNSSGKTNMTFKFWNCIMCSEYFVQKPEVVFRIEHPHLFGSHPDWLYQAAVCQKCHQSLKASKQGTSTTKEATTVSHVETAAGNQLDGRSLTAQLLITNSSSKVSDTNFGTSNVVVSSAAGAVPLQSATTGDDKEHKKESEVLFDCYVCSKQVCKNDRQGKLRRSKFPTLFSNLPESVGITRVCFTCCERLTRQRDRFVSVGISEEDRDYAAHIKIWTGQDISSKLCSLGHRNTDSSTCFVCDKYIPGHVQQEVKTLNRSKFPSLFSVVPDQTVKLLICDACNRKMLKVKGRFDDNNTLEEERDYWVYINSWRDQKGLEKHMYSN